MLFLIIGGHPRLCFKQKEKVNDQELLCTVAEDMADMSRLAACKNQIGQVCTTGYECLARP